MLAIKPVIRALPLCCGALFLMAADQTCDINLNINDGDDDCEDISDVCNLDCELATNDDGCEICECATPDPVGCQSDADCGPNQFCEFRPCPACDPANGTDANCVCDDGGVCVDLPSNCDDGSEALCDMIPPECPAGTILAVQNNCFACVDPTTCRAPDERFCFSDADCAPGEICIFGVALPNGLVAPGGKCVENPCNLIDCVDCRVDEFGNAVCGGDISCANVLCAPGTVCIESQNGPQCVPTTDQCQADTDCGPGARCEQQCLPDPSCPMCDVCLLVNICVEDGCVCPDGSQCQLDAAGNATCEPARDCLSDADCGAGQICELFEACPPCAGNDPQCGIPCQISGICVDVPPPPPPSCLADSDCPQGQICQLTETCPGCNANDPACFAPCLLEGICIDPNACVCPDGSTCRVSADGTAACDAVACQVDSDCGAGSACRNGVCG